MDRWTKSNCPICYGLDLLGDKWTLLIVRDMLTRQKRYYKEFLSSDEGIATNILADRLKRMAEHGLVVREDDPDNKGQIVYRPTEKAQALQPVLDAMAQWGITHGPSALQVPSDMKRKKRNDSATRQ
ncbi:MAG TPA: helix-turn-helix domain-containing protein [Bordetella sp.]